MKHVLIADDHTMFLHGLKLLLEANKKIKITHEAKNGLEILEIVEVNDIDIIIMDINMPKLSGYDTALIINKKYPHIKMIALSMLSDENSITKMLDAGVQAYLHKNASELELFHAIDIVCQDAYYVPNGVEHLLDAHFRKEKEIEKGYIKKENYPLSKRELHIVKYILEGDTNSEIADKLFLSPRTVDTHRKNILAKLKLKNTASLVRFVSENKAFLKL